RLPTSGGFLNDLLTPAVRFNPWVMLLLGPMAPMVSSDSGRGLTGIAATHTHTNTHRISVSTMPSAFITKRRTGSDHSGLVFLICDVFLFNVSAREEKAHHPFEELVHELDGERHHVHLITKKKIQKSNLPCKLRLGAGCSS
uniref:Uncharacterized protein n=1 Tax=Poecilia mexicana TaxID=48701 RepID=A0A3B3XVN3_9TELE